MKTCENCGKAHDGSYASGRFCSATCARSYAGRGNRAKNRPLVKRFKRLWNQTAHNEVTRYLDKKDIRRLKKGKAIHVRVANLCVVLVNKDAITHDEKILQNKIAKLEAKLKEIRREK